MNYQRIYDQLIMRGQQRGDILEYTERHHIIPKCMGGIDEDNIVVLTAREHLIAHWLLHKIYPDNADLRFAFYCMTRSNNNQRWCKGRAYQAAKSISKKHSAESKIKMSIAKIGNTNCVGREYSDETKMKMAASRKGKKASAETIAKMSAAQKGRVFSDEHKAKLKVARRLRNQLGTLL